MPSAYRGVIGARFGRLQMGCAGCLRLVRWSARCVRRRYFDGMAENRASAYGEGVPCWVDAQLPDVEAGKRFYGELFGWTFEATSEAYGGAVWARSVGRPVAALARKADGRLPTVWTVYFATPDIEGLADRVWAAGGQVVTAPVPVGELGTAALVTDQEGAVFGLWQPG